MEVGSWSRKEPKDRSEKNPGGEFLLRMARLAPTSKGPGFPCLELKIAPTETPGQASSRTANKRAVASLLARAWGPQSCPFLNFGRA